MAKDCEVSWSSMESMRGFFVGGEGTSGEGQQQHTHTILRRRSKNRPLRLLQQQLGTEIAQLVERQNRHREVAGSSPMPAENFSRCILEQTT